MSAKRLKPPVCDSSRTPLTIVDDAIREAHRTDAGKFDGLLGNIDEGASLLLADIVRYLRSHLITQTELTETELRERITADVLPPSGLVADNDVHLAINILQMIYSAHRVDSTRSQELILGKSGARDIRRQAGTKKERRADITSWIRNQLEKRPKATRDMYWDNAPYWIKDQIGKDRFLKRVSTERKKLGMSRK